MADEQGTTADEPKTAPEYKAPAKKSLQEIQQMDTEDESLRKYKQALLAGCAVNDDDPRNVRVKKLTISYPEDPEQKSVEIDLTGDMKELKKKVIKMKEGVAYKISLNFIIAREIVAGLNFKLNLYKKGIKFDSTDYMVGSYGPNKDAYDVVVVKDEAPEGALKRGEYTVKGKFTDDDKVVYLECEWKFKICKQWKE